MSTDLCRRYRGQGYNANVCFLSRQVWRPLAVALIATMTSTWVIACASHVKKVDYDASTNPAEEIHRLDGDVKSAFDSHYDVLDPNDFDQAQSYLTEAKTQLSDGKKQEKILDTLGYARAYLNQAQQRANALQDRYHDVLEARSAALKAGIRRFPSLEPGLKEEDDKLRSEAERVANGKLALRTNPSLQMDYLDLELAAIQESKLGNARAKVSGARSNGAAQLTPRTLAGAERSLKNAENMIAVNRHNDEVTQPSVDRANIHADYLEEVLGASKRPGGQSITEEAAIELVNRAHKVSDLDRQLNATNSEMKAKNEEMSKSSAEMKQQLKTAGEALKLDNALESARKEFSVDEAEVYRQGDKLLIRLKAVKFPTGSSNLPENALPLLSKVKSIAESLNPTRVLVEGHTDSTGSAQTNLSLSQERAEAVVTYFASNGLERDKLEAVGYGYKKPLTSNKSKVGRAQNRRVDVIITPANTETSTGSKAM